MKSALRRSDLGSSGSAQLELPLSSLLPHVLFPGRASLSVAEVAKALRVTQRHVLDLVDEGFFPGTVNVAGAGNCSSRRVVRIPISGYDHFVRRATVAENGRS